MMLKFMEQVETPRGPGAVLARVGEKGVLVAILKENLIGNRCSGPVINLVFKEEDVKKMGRSEIIGRSSAAPLRGGG